MNLIASTKQKLHYSQTGQEISDGWLWNKLFDREALVESKKYGLLESVSNGNKAEARKTSPKS